MRQNQERRRKQCRAHKRADGLIGRSEAGVGGSQATSCLSSGELEIDEISNALFFSEVLITENLFR